jgi:hypothetical protein
MQQMGLTPGQVLPGQVPAVVSALSFSIQMLRAIGPQHRRYLCTQHAAFGVLATLYLLSISIFTILNHVVFETYRVNVILTNLET